MLSQTEREIKLTVVPVLSHTKHFTRFTAVWVEPLRKTKRVNLIALKYFKQKGQKNSTKDKTAQLKQPFIQTLQRAWRTAMKGMLLLRQVDFRKRFVRSD